MTTRARTSAPAWVRSSQVSVASSNTAAMMSSSRATAYGKQAAAPITAILITELGALPQAPRDRAHQADLLQERGQRREAHSLRLLVIRVGSGHPACFAPVQSGAVVWRRVGEQATEQDAAQAVDVGDPDPVDPGHLGDALAQTVAGELD